MRLKDANDGGNLQKVVNEILHDSVLFFLLRKRSMYLRTILMYFIDDLRVFYCAPRDSTFILHEERLFY